MNIQYYLKCFSERLRIQRYNPATIKNYQSNVGSFLIATSGQLTFNPDIDLIHVENYFISKTKKESIGSSHQRIILVCISKFYDLVLEKKSTLNIYTQNVLITNFRLLCQLSK